MGGSTSSAEPEQLIRYSDITTELDHALESRARQLRGALEYFERRCRELGMRTPAAYTADGVHGYAGQCEGPDARVREVGRQFLRADQMQLGIGAVAPPSTAATTALPAMPVTRLGLELIMKLQNVPTWLWYWVANHTTKGSLEEWASALQRTSGGEALLREARVSGLCLLLPNGSRLGDPNGTIVEIDRNFAGRSHYSPDRQSTWSIDPGIDIVYHEDLDMVALLGHEIQHALDAAQGLLIDWKTFRVQAATPAEIERQLEALVVSAYDSEVRAFRRYISIARNIPYTDVTIDDRLSGSKTVRDALSDEYIPDYVNALKEKVDYPVSVFIDDHGHPRVRLLRYVDRIVEDAA